MQRPILAISQIHINACPNTPCLVYLFPFVVEDPVALEKEEESFCWTSFFLLGPTSHVWKYFLVYLVTFILSAPTIVLVTGFQLSLAPPPWILHIPFLYWYKIGLVTPGSPVIVTLAPSLAAHGQQMVPPLGVSTPVASSGRGESSVLIVCPHISVVSVLRGFCHSIIHPSGPGHHTILLTSTTGCNTLLPIDGVVISWFWTGGLVTMVSPGHVGSSFTVLISSWQVSFLYPAPPLRSSCNVSSSSLTLLTSWPSLPSYHSLFLHHCVDYHQVIRSGEHPPVLMLFLQGCRVGGACILLSVVILTILVVIWWDRNLILDRQNACVCLSVKKKIWERLSGAKTLVLINSKKESVLEQKYVGIDQRQDYFCDHFADKLNILDCKFKLPRKMKYKSHPFCQNPNSTTTQLNRTWVRHENDFANHPTPNHTNSMSAISQLLLPLFWPNFQG